MKLKNACTLDVACCTGNATISEAARLMRQHHTGDLVVIDDTDGDRIPVGIITDRDIVIEVLGKGLDPSKTAVAGVMSRQLVVADSCEDVSEAVERMRAHGVRRIPVTGDNGVLVGIFTLDDLLKLNADQLDASVAIVSKEQTRESRARR
jgi:CBS domain-containing protein